MEIGIFTKTYPGKLEAALSKISRANIKHVQLNLASAAMETMPAAYDKEKITWIKDTVKEHGIIADVLSGTFNMIDPDATQRREDIRRFEILCQIACELEIPVISLCTGSKNPQSKWQWSDENLKDDAWEDLLETTKKILPFAEKHNVVLGVETEASNIVNTPQRAREYLDTMKTPHLKIIMDGANLFLPSQIKNMQSTLEDAFRYLGHDIISVHAKDIAPGEGLEFVAAGEGLLDYTTYVKLLKQYNYTGALILHGLSAAQVPASMRFLKEVLGHA